MRKEENIVLLHLLKSLTVPTFPLSPWKDRILCPSSDDEVDAQVFEVWI